MERFGELSSAEKTILEYAGLNAFSRLAWLENGAPVDWNRDRILADWEEGHKKVREQLYPLTVADALTETISRHAELLWRQNGAVKNHDLVRINNDWHNAKRYVGYLIADNFVSCCLKKKYETEEECYRYLREEYIEYLVDLSAEEYIRIKAYFMRHAGEAQGENFSDDHYYFAAERELNRSRTNCKRLSFEDRAKTISDAPKNYLLDNCDLTKIASRKEFTLTRLRLNSTMVQEYMDKYYPVIRTAINRLTLDKNQAIDLYELIRANNAVSNMLEFLLRCAICAAIPLEEYEKKSGKVT